MRGGGAGPRLEGHVYIAISCLSRLLIHFVYCYMLSSSDGVGSCINLLHSFWTDGSQIKHKAQCFSQFLLLRLLLLVLLLVSSLHGILSIYLTLCTVTHHWPVEEVGHRGELPLELPRVPPGYIYLWEINFILCSDGLLLGSSTTTPFSVAMAPMPFSAPSFPTSPTALVRPVYRRLSPSLRALCAQVPSPAPKPNF